MAINYGIAYRKFRDELKKKHELYKELGMSQEQIDAIDEYDWSEFRANCVYQVHTQSLDTSTESDFGDDQNPLYKKFGDVLTVELTFTFRDRFSWLDDISSPTMLKKLLSLSPEDLDILDASVFGEKSQTEIAIDKGISQKNICKKLKRIKKYLSED